MWKIHLMIYQYISIKQKKEKTRKSGMNSETVQILIYFFEYLISLFLAITMHELGHVITALCYKWEFVYLIIGPIKIYKADDGLKLCFEKRIALWGGISHIYPKKVEEKTVVEYSNVFIMGPVFSILSGVVFAALYYVSHVLVFMMCAVMSFGIGVALLLPIRRRIGGVYLDGYRYYRIRKRGLESNDEIAVLEIWSLIYQNPKISYKELVKIVDSRPLSSDYIWHFVLHYIIFEHIKKTGDAEAVDEETEKIKALLKKIPDKIANAYSFD